MITLLGGFHAIAAARGDGLHPELLRAAASSPASTEIERTGDITVDGIGSKPIGEMERRGRSAEVVALPLRSRC